MTDPRDSMRWLWRGVVLAFLVIGWGFIAWQNHFHVTAPMVFVCLGYLAAEDEPDSTWARSGGALGELEREKRTLLKAIKEAEFDHQMGKLSQRDADEMIRGYRARAIEVIKEIDQLGLGSAGTVREQILREVRARVQLDGKSPRKADAKVKADAGKRPDAADRPADKSTDKSADKAAQKAEAAAAPAKPAEAAATVDVPRDDELDADSPPALDPRHDPGKEATP